MATRQEIVDEARSYVGTRFHHQARVKGVAVDCIGLLVGVARALGLFEHDNRSYSRHPDGHTLLEELEKVLDRVEEGAEPELGDVLVFWISERTKRPQHIAIKSDVGMIHTYAHIGKVVETHLTKAWRRRICAVFRFRGLE